MDSPRGSLPFPRSEKPAPDERMENWRAYRRLTVRPYSEATYLPESSTPEGRKVKSVQTDDPRNKRVLRRPYKKSSRKAALSPEQERKKALYLIKEFLSHCIFLVLVFILAFGRINAIMYYYSSALYKLFTTKVFYDENIKITAFNDINTIPEFWTYLRKDFVDSLFMNFDIQSPNHFDDALLVLKNALIGTVRIRQVRVRNNSCTIPTVFQNVFPACYDYYSKEEEDQEPFGLNEGTAWTFNDASTLGSGWYSGKISWYGGGGYYVDLFNNLQETQECIEDLWNHTWIDRATRAIFIDFTTYTPNINMFCSAKLVAEFPPFGGVLTDSNFWTVQHLRYLNWWDLLVLPFELCFVFMVCGFTVFFCIRICCLEKCRTLLQWWHFVELAILLASYSVIGFTIYLFFITNDELKKAYENLEMDIHYSFEHLDKIQWVICISVAWLVFLVVLKLLKFMPLTQTTNRLHLSFVQCFKELRGIVLVMLVLFAAFAEMGHMLFGFNVEEFCTITNSMKTLLLVVVGQFNYQKVEHTDRVLALIYFSMYIIVVLLFLVSLFIAAVVYAYAKVNRSYYDASDGQKYFPFFVKKFYVKLMKKFGCKQKASRIENKFREREYESDYERVYAMLARAGFNDVEVESFLKGYNITRDEPVNLKTVERLALETNLNKLDVKKKRYDQLMEHVNQLSENVNNVSRRAAELTEKLELVVDLLLKEDKGPRVVNK